MPAHIHAHPFHAFLSYSMLFEKEEARLRGCLADLNIPLTLSVPSANDRTASKIPKRTPTKKATKPLYAWELAKKEETVRHPINLEHGTYLPSHTQGIYNLLGEDDLEENRRHIDYQVILTEDELMTIVARQRAVRAEQQHRQRFTNKVKENKLGIMASGPYMDSKRVMKDHYRHDHPDKFTVKGGFRPSGTMSKDKY
jgi:hypothetical protein